MSPRPKSPPPDRRQEILAAALKVFADKGYQAATNAEIAREAGVTAAALYYYFPSKGELFRAVIADRAGSLQPLAAQVSQHMMDLPPEAVIPPIIQNMVQFMSDARTEAIMRILLSEGPRFPEIVKNWQAATIEPVASLFQSYVQRQIQLGRLPAVNPRLPMVLLQGPIVLTMIFRDLLHLDLTEGLTNEVLTHDLTALLLGTNRNRRGE